MQKDKQRGKNDHKDSDTRDYHSDTQQPKRDKWTNETPRHKKVTATVTMATVA